MRENHLRATIAARETAVNGWISAQSTYAAEVLSYAGFDGITIDVQHGMVGVEGAIAMLQAISAGPAMPMARCPSLDPAVIGKLLDAGAYAIICPSIDTAEQAASFVAACRYPPTGRRSFGPSRGLLYGGDDYARGADAAIMAWAMVESVESMSNLDAILSTPGLDGIYVGPNDLALSMGHPPGAAVPADEVDAAMEGIRAATAAVGMATGVFCASADMAARMAERGWNMVTPGNDIAILKEGAAARILQVRGSVRPHTAGVSSPRSVTSSGGY